MEKRRDNMGIGRLGVVWLIAEVRENKELAHKFFVFNHLQENLRQYMQRKIFSERTRR